MKTIYYIDQFTDEDRLRIRFTQHKNRILKFTIQYESLIDGYWHKIWRADKSHRSTPHIHRFHLHKKQFQVELDQKDIGRLFNELKRYIRKNYKKIRDNYLISK